MRKSLPAAVTAAIGIAVLAPLSAAAMDHEDGASLSVLHGVPDLTVPMARLTDWFARKQGFQGTGAML